MHIQKQLCMYVKHMLWINICIIFPYCYLTNFIIAYTDKHIIDYWILIFSNYKLQIQNYTEHELYTMNIISSHAKKIRRENITLAEKKDRGFYRTVKNNTNGQYTAVCVCVCVG